MKKCIELSSGLPLNEFFYCYSIQDEKREGLHPEGGKFCQFTNRIENGYLCNFTEKTTDVNAFIGALYKERITGDFEIKTACFYEGSGAPMIVISDDISERNGYNVFNTRTEIVVYKNGVNVWDVKNDEENGKLIPTKLGFLKFPIAEREIIFLSVKKEKNILKITANGNDLSVALSEKTERAFAGIMACEGKCGFYSVTLEK